MTNKTNWISDNHIRVKFDSKQRDAEERGIYFGFTRKEFKHLWRTNDQHCDYTGTLLTTDVGFPNTASLDRIDESKGYVIGNVCIVRSDINLLKSFTVETKVDSRDITITKDQKALIKKMCETLYDKDKLKALKEKYIIKEPTKATINEDTDEVSDTVAKETKTVQVTQVEPPQIVSQQPSEEFYDQEVAFARHYITLATELKQCNMVMSLTLGELKKKLLATKDFITGEKFTCIEDKYFFVLNLTKPITKGNIVITTKSTRDAMYTLVARGGSLAKISLNLHKLEQK